MRISTDNFGPLIAYLLPGFVTLIGISFFSETVRDWFASSRDIQPTVGGFLYVTLGSTAAGLIVSAVRWVAIDQVLHRTGVPEPKWNFSQFPQKVPAFLAIVDNHYRYYQFYSNMLVAVTFSYVADIIVHGLIPFGWIDIGFAFVWGILFAASRDTLKKYYRRANDVFGNTRNRRAQSSILSTRSRNRRPFSKN